MPEMGTHGTGGIYARKNGLFEVRITFEGGRRISRYARDRKSAERLQRELMDAREADLDPSRLTVEVFLRSWIDSLTSARNQRLAPKTLTHYTQIVNDHIIPALGKFRLDRLKEHHVQAWLDKDRGSPRSVHHHRAVLRRGLNVALRRRLITVNPAVGVELPEARFEGQPLTFEEAKALLEATEGDRLHALWALAIDTGLRQSELLGLGWDDVDLEGKAVTVRSQLQRIGGQWVRRQTKAHRGLSRLAITEATADALRDHQKRMAAERTASWRYFGLVFPSPAGDPLHESVVLDAFHDACDKADIPQRRFHDLRGTSASLMRDLGVAEDTRMARYGHNTTAMARHYAKAAESQDRAASDALGEALSR